VGTAATASGAAVAGATAGAGIAARAAVLAPWAAALAPAAAVAVASLALCGVDAKDPAEEAEFVMMQAQGAVPCTMLLGEGRFGKRTKADASSLCETTTVVTVARLGR